MSPPPFCLPRAFLNLLAATVSLVGVLCVSELATRILRPDLTVGADERIFFCAYDPRLGWSNQRNAEGRFFKTQVNHNAHGQRDKPRQTQRSGDGLRAMALGDSFVWGYRVEARDRFTDRLEALLPGSEIMNFGCSGYGQDQEYLLLQREIRRWRPDVVVVGVHVASDLENNVSSFQYGYYKPLYRITAGKLVLGNVPVPRDSLGTRINQWMTARSALWNLLGDRSIGEVAVRTRVVNALNALSFSSRAKAVRSNVSRVEMTCTLCSNIRDLSAGKGARALFLLIPDVQVRDQSIPNSPDYAKLRDCLMQRQVDVLDLEPVFREYRASHPKSAVTLAGDRHWSPEGNAVVSLALRDYLQSHPVDKRPPAPDPR